MVSAIHRWLETTVQPAAREAFGSPVARIIGSSYSCRTVYSRSDTQLSQHAFANAIDLPVLMLANGRRVDIAEGWGATQYELASTTAKSTWKSKQSDRQISDATAPFVRAGAGPTEVKVMGTASAVKRSAGRADEIPIFGLDDPLARPEGRFWRRIHRGACADFSTVLGPEANEAHRNHLHLDLQERGILPVCK
jgi:hypothetical protein